jgi:hypothetical protein
MRIFPQSRLLHAPTRGFGLVEALIAASVTLVVAVGISGLMKDSSKSTSSASKLDDLSTLRMSLLENLNCQRTLGVAIPGAAGCGGPYTLRRGNNSIIPSQYGSPATWEIRSRCIANELIVEAHQVGVVTATRELSAVTRLRRDWFDLFDGTSDFCRPYFSGSPACPAPQTLVGMAGPVAVCGPGAWPVGSYCIVQAQSQGCPAGFSAQDPTNSSVPGNGLQGESILVRGNSWSHVSTGSIPFGMNNSFNGPVKTWAWCCK